MTTLPAQPKPPPLLALPALPLPAPAKADRAPRAQQPRAEFARKLSERREAHREPAEAAAEPTKTPETQREAGSNRADQSNAAASTGRVEPRADTESDAAVDTAADAGAEASGLPDQLQPANAAAAEKPESEPPAARANNEPILAGAELNPNRPTSAGGQERATQDEGLQPAAVERARADGAAAAEGKPADLRREAVDPRQGAAARKETVVRRADAARARVEGGDRSKADRGVADGAEAAELDGADAAAAKIDRPLTIRQLNELLLRIDPKVATNGLLKLATGGTEHLAMGDQTAATPPRAERAEAVAEWTPVGGAASPAQPFQAVAKAESVVAERPVTEPGRPTGQRGAVEPSAKPREAASTGMVAQSEAAAENKAPPAPAVAASKPAFEARVGIAPVAGTFSAPRVTSRAGTPTEQAGTKAPTAEHALTAQVQRGLAAAIAQGGGQVTLRMQPMALGQLRVRLEMRADVVRVRFEVGSAAARSLLDEQLPGLGRMLEDQGLRVAHASVGTDPSLATREAHPSHDAAGGQAAMDGGGPWTGGERGAGDGAAGHGAWEHANGPQTPGESGSSPRSGGVFIEGEGGVLDPVTARLNALA